MYRVILSPEAEDDLVRIYRYIAFAGFPENGTRFVEKIADFCQGLTTFPKRGTARPDVAKGIRTISFNQQVTVIFEVVEEQMVVNIGRIVQRRRDVERALKYFR